MAAHNQTSDDPLPDEKLAELLRDAAKSESPREEFVSSLGERLESELCTVLAESDEPPLQRQVASGQTETAAASRVSRSRGRSLFALATAVVLCADPTADSRRAARRMCFACDVKVAASSGNLCTVAETSMQSGHVFSVWRQDTETSHLRSDVFSSPTVNWCWSSDKSSVRGRGWLRRLVE